MVVARTARTPMRVTAPKGLVSPQGGGQLRGEKLPRGHRCWVGQPRVTGLLALLSHHDHGAQQPGEGFPFWGVPPA